MIDTKILNLESKSKYLMNYDLGHDYKGRNYFKVQLPVNPFGWIGVKSRTYSFFLQRICQKAFEALLWAD